MRPQTADLEILKREAEGAGEYGHADWFDADDREFFEHARLRVPAMVAEIRRSRDALREINRIASIQRGSRHLDVLENDMESIADICGDVEDGFDLDLDEPKSDG